MDGKAEAMKGLLEQHARETAGLTSTDPVEHLWYLANHDSLTGLFNRRRLMEELEREVAVSRRTGKPGAVLMLDLDDFKDVNDALGHMAGDSMLAKVGEGVRSRLRSTDALARLGGDEFAIVLPDCTPESARQVGAELVEAVQAAATVTVAGRERPVSVSIGIAPFGNGEGDMDHTADGLLVEADLAMYRAKGRGGARLEVYDEQMRTELAERLRVEGDLRHALANDELVVHYQPIVSVEDGNPVGCEALVRWNSSSRGLVQPQAFIPIAEERGLIGEIGARVLDEACRQARAWRRNGRRVYVSVNVSPVQLLRDDVLGMVEDTLKATGLPAPLLTLEVTESSLIEDVKRLAPALDSLKGRGVRMAIDDFGGGASSLSYLSALPIDVIKIDRLFIDGLSSGRPDDRAIVAAVISLAEELDLTVIAEGVETERQHWDLRELRCRFAQGFLYGMPAPPAELHLDGYAAAMQAGVGDPSVVREFMRQIGIPAARVGV